MSTTALRDGDSYVIDGGKVFISNAGIADFYTVFASTDRSKGTRGISCFVVPADTPGLRFVRAQVMSSPHPLGEIAFDGCRVPAANVLGKPGGGMRVFDVSMTWERGCILASTVGTMERQPKLPDVPTLNESGFPKFEAFNYWAIWAPKGTPQPIVDKLIDTSA